ncbi:MAG TPA: arsinothricin resistance N-acetyltransferase ArsN1 family B [Flavisolibacter sp.]|jgi:phosphinothricin acetyltransferase|nr:arsinothricin resistance N-acetyltransferase ArsN1 family B [Flavisolibacter sp.]
MIEIRPATVNDAEGILAIYAPYILDSYITFENEVPSPDEFRQRIRATIEKRPWLVAVVNGTIAGYVYAAAHRDRVAYQWSVESSVYIHDDFKGKGLARILYNLLFDVLKYQGFRNVYAGITLPNEASVQLHEKCGFTFFASYENVGFKTGAWKEVGWWRLVLNDFDSEPAPPLLFSELDPRLFADAYRSAAQKLAERITG